MHPPPLTSHHHRSPPQPHTITSTLPPPPQPRRVRYHPRLTAVTPGAGSLVSCVLSAASTTGGSARVVPGPPAPYPTLDGVVTAVAASLAVAPGVFLGDHLVFLLPVGSAGVANVFEATRAGLMSVPLNSR